MKVYCAMKQEHGVTLIEMLVVVLIIGILGAVAMRTIDATSYQAKFDKTSKEMSEILIGIVGNPAIVSEGRRVSFGYVGDLGQLPENLNELINSSDVNWKGPYVSRQFVEDTTGFKFDEWGNPYLYDPANLILQSTGGGKQNLTMKIADSLVDLFENQISGTITDIYSAPPANFASNIRIKLTVPNNGALIDYEITPRNDGYYEFTPPDYPVPIGYHKMVVSKQYGTGDSLVRWISVTPRSRVIGDFRFASGFHDNLKYVTGSAVTYASVGDTVKNNIGFQVFNSGPDITLDSMIVTRLDTTAFYEQVKWEANVVWNYTHPNRAGVGDIVAFSPNPVIPTNSITRFDIVEFKEHKTALPAAPVAMHGVKIVIKFSDGSVIDFIP
ncbi:MAG: type II secretion system protein [Candidatus Latescibacteria bacterium]|nr:type II secretion system protein [Candidatus Latescibacterota bacterium]